MEEPYEKFHDKAIRLVYEYLLDAEQIPPGFSTDDVTIVWFCKTLKNWKAMVIAHLPDSYFFEVTYNGNRGESYLDVYGKIRNVRIEDNPYVTINIVNPPVEDPAEMVRRTKDRLMAQWI